MLRVLWLIIWATVGETFYDDYSWYSPHDGIDNDNRAFEYQKYVRDNFTGNLRTFANSYGLRGDGEDDMTISKAKSKLRLLKVYKYTRGSSDFDSAKERLLPLAEGAKFCTMGTHTKVDCNYCTCVAGQLYMCTGMICPKSPTRPQFLSTCREGKKRKIDSCNYCYCRNGHEICTTRDCRHNHDNSIVRSESECPEGKWRKVDCNRCLCINGEEYCTNMLCPDNLVKLKEKDLPKGRCSKGAELKINCVLCKCINRRWRCSEKACHKNLKYKIITQRAKKRRCKEGTSRALDSCNKCYCRKGQEYCENKDCGKVPQSNFPLLRMTDSKCIEGLRYKIDSCNYCFCFNGSETCTYRNCREVEIDNMECDPLRDGESRTIECNFCICRKSLYRLLKHDDYTWRWRCTKRECYPEFIDYTNLRYYLLRRRKECDKWDVKYEKCNRCECHGNVWVCTKKSCSDMKLKSIDDEKEGLKYWGAYLSLQACRDGQKRKLDACSDCICRNGQWACQINECDKNNPESGGPYKSLNAEDYFKSIPVVKRPVINKKFLNQTKLLKNDFMKAIEKLSEDTDFEYVPEKLDENGKELLLFAMDQSLLSNCIKGRKRRIDSCNYCTCRNGQWFCENKECSEEYSKKRILLNWPDLSSLPKKCNPGDKWTLPCHDCVCFGDRNSWWCPRNKRCKKEERMLRMMHYGIMDLPETKCKLGDRFRFGACNYCYCDKNNKRVCSRHKCPYPKPNQTRYQPPQIEKQCKIGDRFRLDECNYCYCDYERNFICSRNKCSGSKLPLRNTLYYECEEGDTHQIDDCNYCRCSSKKRWKCTQNICPSVYDHFLLRSQKKSCIDKSHRVVNDCNYCICLKGVEVCTQKACLHDHPSRTYLHFTEPECITGEHVPAPDACNLCICLNSNIMCTEFPCVRRKSVTGRSAKCVEGHKYFLADGCNYCLCQEGQEFCTSRACLVDDDSSKKPQGSCIEGEVKQASDGCNMCVCSEGKITCTNKDCYRVRLRSETSDNLLSLIRAHKQRGFDKGSRYKKHKNRGTCEQGQYYLPDDNDPYCPNECICDRNELLCTNRKCEWGKPPAQFSWKPRKSKDKRRNPKQLLKQEICAEYEPLPSDDPCNTCICLNERKVCTIIPCSSSEKDEPGSDEIKISSKVHRGNKGNMDKKRSAFCEPFTFFSPDNNRFCRNCFCLHNGLALCLLNLCKYSKDIPHHKSQELNSVCTPGETGYPTKCVTCTCSDKGKWICTREELALCQERDCDAKDEFHMGFYPYCAGCKCSVKEWFCSIKAETCQDYSNAKCPIGTFIHNPNQHCSICLCGGYEAGSHNMCFTEAKCVRQVINHLKD